MGFKAASIFVNERGPGYFGKLPVHDPSKARALARALELQFSEASPSTFEDGLWPTGGTFALGAYDGGMILADQDTLFAAALESNHAVRQKVLEMFPAASILCVSLHSVVNAWGYALYEHGRLVRQFGGDADSGIMINFGDLQPEEKPYFARSRETSPSRRTFQVEMDGQLEEFEENAIGEELVFQLASRFFGQPLDHYKPVDLFQLQLELFTKAKAPQRAPVAPTPRKVITPRPSQKPWWKLW